jgi:predicted nucleic acid-binding protein
VADSYARLAARIVAVGRQPRARVMNLLIAATAHAHDAIVYTRNAADLAGIEDLVTIASI